MKRVLIWVMVLILVFSATTAFAGMEDRLIGHWSQGLIDGSFLTYYFPYLARNNFEKLNPITPISSKDFLLSTASLLDSFGYKISPVAESHTLLRRDMVSLLSPAVKELGLEVKKDYRSPFKDISLLNSEDMVTLNILNQYKIIHGDSNESFSPNRELSQAEAIIILQRIDNLCKNIDTIDDIKFELLSSIQSFDNREEMVINNLKDRVLITITKEFPTPGYSLEVQRIIKADEGYIIKLNIVKPETNKDIIQVITYQTLSIEILKENLQEAPHNFTLEGYNKI